MTREGRIVRFGVFEVDLGAGELRKSGLRIKLQDQPFQILCMLLERPGEVITREELRNRLWPGTFVDFDHNLNASVNKLREALGDSASSVRFIETVPRRGYRFVAPVQRTAPVPPNEPRIDKSRGKAIAIGSVIVALAIASGGAALWNRHKTGARPNLVSQVVPLTSEEGMELQPTFSPDGNLIAYVGDPPGPEGPAIFVKQIGSEAVRRLTSGSEPAVSPKWSPDGRYVAFVRVLERGEFVRAAVLAVPALGGAERNLQGAQIALQLPTRGFLIDWFGDSQHMVITDQAEADVRRVGSSLFVLNTRTGERRRITTPPPGGLGDRDPAVSPDGRRLAFTRDTGHGISADIYLLELDAELRPSGKPRRLTSGSGSRAPAWMPDGSEIVFAAGPLHRKRLWRMRVDDPSGAETLPFAAEGSLALTAAISRRRQIAYPTFRVHVDMYRTELMPDGTAANTEKILGSTFIEHLPEYSPQGDRIAFVSNRSGAQEIWISGSDGSNPYQLTSFHGDPEITWPRWSPDGSRLVFAGSSSVYVVDVRGGRPVRLVTDMTSEGAADWSGDGKWVYIGADRTGRTEVWKVPVHGGDSDWMQITRSGGGAPRASPDGKFVYYTKGRTSAELWRVPVDGGAEVRVIDSLRNNGTFTISRRGIYYIPDGGVHEPAAIEFLDTRTGARRTVAPVRGGPLWGLAVSPDERSIIHVAMDEPESDLMLLENFR